MPPRYRNTSAFPTMDSHCFSKSALSWVRFCSTTDTEISLDLMVASIFSNWSGSATLANSSMMKWTCTGSLPPYILSAVW